MTQGALIGVAVLFGVSLLVRIIPSFMRVDFSDDTRENIRTVLPVAVFINHIAYCMASEVAGNTVAAAAGFALLFALMIGVKRAGLLGAVGLASLAFVLMKGQS